MPSTPVIGLVVILGSALALGGTARAQQQPRPSGDATTAAAPMDPNLSARDRITFNAGLDALVAGDLVQARRLFTTLATEGDSATVRSAAVMIVDRIGGLERRRDAGLVPRLQAPLVTREAPAPAPAAKASSNARAPVVATTTFLGLTLWGWTLPGLLGVDSGDQTRAFLGLYMTTAATSFAVPYLITREHTPSDSQLNLIFYGGTRGAAWGAMLANLLFGDATGTGSDHPQAFSGGLLLGSLCGVVAGGLLTPRLDLSPGEARTIAAAGDSGLFIGMALAHILSPADDASDTGRTSGKRARILSTGGLLGSALGLGAGHWLARNRDNTWGDAEVMRGATALGVLAGATAVIGFDYQDNSKLLLGFMAAGGALGMVGGDAFVRDTSFTPGEALLVDLALVTGGLGAAGLTYLIANADGPRPYFLTGTAGAAIAGGLIAQTLGGGGSGDRRAQGRGGAVSLTLLPQFGASGPSGLSVLGAF
jgi:hypothetical protein